MAWRGGAELAGGTEQHCTIGYSTALNCTIDYSTALQVTREYTAALHCTVVQAGLALSRQPARGLDATRHGRGIETGGTAKTGSSYSIAGHFSGLFIQANAGKWCQKSVCLLAMECHSCHRESADACPDCSSCRTVWCTALGAGLYGALHWVQLGCTGLPPMGDRPVVGLGQHRQLQTAF